MPAKAGIAALVFTATMLGLYLVGGRPQTVDDVGLQAVRAALRDPPSGQFGPYQKHTSIDGRRYALCGQVRGKNLFGMMADYQGFVVVVREDERGLHADGVAFQDPVQPRAYEEAQRHYCRDRFL